MGKLINKELQKIVLKLLNLRNLKCRYMALAP
jgi:hypothetical protein